MDLRTYGVASLVAFVLAWALACSYAVERSGVAGFSTSAKGLVTHVRAGGPAEAAGIRVGDVLSGVRMAGSAATVPLERVPVGDTRVLSVLREGATLEMAIRFEARQGADRWRPRLLTALGLWLLFLTARGYHRHPGRLGGILFLAGAGIALACFGEPDFDSGAGRAALMALRNAVVLGGLGAMVQFILEYVHPGHRAHWIYAPMAAYWLVLDWRLLAPGAAGLAGVAGILGGVLLVLSLALVLVAITRTWIRGRKRNMPPGIGLVFHVTVGGFAMLLAAATAQRLWNLPWLVDAAGAVLLLAAAWAWSRAASAA